MQIHTEKKPNLKSNWMDKISTGGGKQIKQHNNNMDKRKKAG